MKITELIERLEGAHAELGDEAVVRARSKQFKMPYEIKKVTTEQGDAYIEIVIK